MAESKLKPWIKARAVQLIAHNNHAERPFAVTKLFDHWFPSMSFGNMKGKSGKGAMLGFLSKQYNTRIVGYKPEELGLCEV